MLQQLDEPLRQTLFSYEVTEGNTGSDRGRRDILITLNRNSFLSSESNWLKHFNSLL